MHNYSIDQLVELFKQHAEKNEAMRKVALEANPDCEWAKNDFCISQALHCICNEIKDLNEEIP